MTFDEDDIAKISAADLRIIILGLKVSNFNINDEKIKNDVWKEIVSLPSAEKINEILSKEESFENIRSRVGHIMEVISKYSKRDIYNKARYKSKTGLDPMHSVLDYVHAAGVRFEKTAINKQAGWWDSIVGGLNKGVEKVDVQPQDVVHGVSASLAAAKESLYTSYREILSAIEDAEDALKGVTDKKSAFVLDKIINELKDDVSAMRDNMSNLNTSLEDMNATIEKEMSEYVEPQSKLVSPPTDDEVKSKYEEITIREKEEEIAKRQEEIARLGLLAGDTYYYESPVGALFPFRLKDTKLSESGKLIGINTSGANQELDPSLFRSVEDVKGKLKEKLTEWPISGDQNNQTYKKLKDAYLEIERGNPSTISGNAYKLLKNLDARPISAKRNVFNLMRMSRRTF